MLRQLLTTAAVSTALASAPAHAFLLNWQLDPDGAAGTATKTTISEFLDIVGPSYVQTTVPNQTGQFTFNEWGAMYSPGHDGLPGYDGFSGMLSALFTTTGNATLGGQINYTGGIFNVYTATPSTYATSAGIYGSDTGTLIGTFSVFGGGGLIDPTGLPNGMQSLYAIATSLAAGYWFDSAGNDLATMLSQGALEFGFATTNASRIANPTTLGISEIVNQYAGDATFTNCLPGEAPSLGNPDCTGNGEFMISNNGQYRLQVPEPGTLALMGLGLLGLGFRRRQK